MNVTDARAGEAGCSEHADVVYLQWNPGWETWQEVLPRHAGEEGVVAFRRQAALAANPPPADKGEPVASGYGDYTPITIGSGTTARQAPPATASPEAIRKAAFEEAAEVVMAEASKWMPGGFFDVKGFCRKLATAIRARAGT